MNDKTEAARLQVRGPGDMTQLIPYMVGFNPEESLVISVIQNHVVQVTARVDIVDVQPAGEVERLLDRIWARFPGSDAYLMAYTADPMAGWDLLQRCDAHLPADSSRQTLLVDGDTWHLPNGETGPVERVGPLATSATNSGLQRLNRRADLEAGFASPPDTTELEGQVEDAIDRLPNPSDTRAIINRTSELLHSNLTADDHAAPDLNPVDAIQLAVLVQNDAARDVALLSMTRQDAAAHLKLWQDVVNRAPAHGAEIPLYLAGMAAWISGDGASASIAHERSLAATGHPDQPTAMLLGELINQVIPPRAWDSMRASVLAQADPRVQSAVVDGAPAASPAAWETLAAPPVQQAPLPRDIDPPTPRIAI